MGITIGEEEKWGGLKLEPWGSSLGGMLPENFGSSEVSNKEVISLRIKNIGGQEERKNVWKQDNRPKGSHLC